MGNLGRGFIHVLAEELLVTVLGELDTVSDFTAYLRAVENLQERGTQVDLLAMYLADGRKLPEKYKMLVTGEGIWSEFSKRPEYRAKKAADGVSSNSCLGGASKSRR